MTERPITETWELVRTDRVPVIGELRFVREFVPNPAEPLAQLLPGFQQVVWTGTEWAKIDGAVALGG